VRIKKEVGEWLYTDKYTAVPSSVDSGNRMGAIARSTVRRSMPRTL
jgi:hypothetical protein